MRASKKDPNVALLETAAGVDSPNRSAQSAADGTDDTQAAQSTAEVGGDTQALGARAPRDIDIDRIGHFIVLEKLGQGGMGVVYAAYDNHLDRKVAIKLVRGTSKQAYQRMHREAQSMAKLSHPNVVQIYEVGVLEQQIFVVMEFVKGRTLRRWIASEPRSWREVLDLYLQAGQGLAAAHQAGLVHRDVKPDNVFVGDDGRVRVGDFGLARAPSTLESARMRAVAAPAGLPLDDAPDAAIADEPAPVDLQLTVTGSILGTPAYMSPEQHTGALTDEKSDQFGFCVSLYEGLYGQTPFAGKTQDELADNVRAGALRPPPSGRQVPLWLYKVIARGLAVDPAARWPSLAELLASLADDPARRRRRYRNVALITLAISSVLLGAGWSAESYRQRAQTEHVAKQRAQAQRDRALADLRLEVRRARDAARMIATQRLAEIDPTTALALVREIEAPDEVAAWPAQAAVLARARVAEAVLEGHESGVWEVTFSPDSSLVVTASEDHTARVFRVGGDDKSIALRGHTDIVRGAHFSPDGAHIVTASYDRTARVWNTDGSGEPIVLRGHEGWLYAASYSPDGRRIATASFDRTIRLWNADGSGEPVVLRGHDGPVRSVTFSSDGTRLFSSSFDGTVRMWNLGSGEPPIQPIQPIILATVPTRLYGAALSPDDSQIALACDDGLVRVVPVGGGVPKVIGRHDDTVYTVDFGPDGTWVVSASRDKTARIWRLAQVDAPIPLVGHSGFAMAARASPDGRHVVTAGYDGTARIWRVQGHEPLVLRGPGGRLSTAVYSPDGALIAVGGDGGTARIQRADGTGEPVILPGHVGTVDYAVFSPDGSHVATADDDGVVHVWQSDGSGAPLSLRGHSEQLIGLEYSPDGTRLLSSSFDHTARLWDAATGRELAVLRGHEARVLGANFNRSGTRIASASDDTTARVWDAQTGESLAVLRGHSGSVTTASFSPDGAWVVTASADHTVRVWRADGTGEPIVLRGHGDTVHAARFSPDGRTIASGSSDRTVRVWRADGTGEPIVLRGPREAILMALFTPDGAHVLALSDRDVWLWNADGTGDPLVLRGHDGPVTSTDFSPDGERLLTASVDGTVRIWSDIEPWDSLRAALWRTSMYCPSVATRDELIGFGSERSAADLASCRAAVARAAVTTESR